MHDNKDVLALPDRLFVSATAFLDLNDEIDEAQKRNNAEMEQIHATNPVEQKTGQYLHMNRPVIPNDASLQ